MPDTPYYPAFLDLKNKETVVVGGGIVSERKIQVLLKSGAIVSVISPTISPGIEKLKAKGKIHHVSRTFRSGDVRKAFLVIAATDSPEVNAEVARHAPCLVNVVDTPSQCNFIAPSVMRRGRLTLAISTGGASPAFSRAIRKELEGVYGTDFARYLDFAGRIRTQAMKDIPHKKEREIFLKGLASDKILRTLRTGGFSSAKKHVMEHYEKVLSRSARLPRS